MIRDTVKYYLSNMYSSIIQPIKYYCTVLDYYHGLIEKAMVLSNTRIITCTYLL